MTKIISEPTPDQLAQEINGLIQGLNQPYRGHMVQWLQRRFKKPGSNLGSDLSGWLAQMDEFSRLDQFHLLSLVASQATRVFARGPI